MENEKKTLWGWVMEHKKELIIAGITVSAIFILIMSIRNHDALEEVWASLKELIKKQSDNDSISNALVAPKTVSFSELVEASKSTAERAPHDVCEHIRTLPNGWCASAEKIASAAERGYELQLGQTWVESYRTGTLAA